MKSRDPIVQMTTTIQSIKLLQIEFEKKFKILTSSIKNLGLKDELNALLNQITEQKDELIPSYTKIKGNLIKADPEKKQEINDQLSLLETEIAATELFLKTNYLKPIIHWLRQWIFDSDEPKLKLVEKKEAVPEKFIITSPSLKKTLDDLRPKIALSVSHYRTHNEIDLKALDKKITTLRSLQEKNKAVADLLITPLLYDCYMLKTSALVAAHTQPELEQAVDLFKVIRNLIDKNEHLAKVLSDFYCEYFFAIGQLAGFYPHTSIQRYKKNILGMEMLAEAYTHGDARQKALVSLEVTMHIGAEPYLVQQSLNRIVENFVAFSLCKEENRLKQLNAVFSNFDFIVMKFISNHPNQKQNIQTILKTIKFICHAADLTVKTPQIDKYLQMLNNASLTDNTESNLQLFKTASELLNAGIREKDKTKAIAKLQDAEIHFKKVIESAIIKKSEKIDLVKCYAYLANTELQLKKYPAAFATSHLGIKLSTNEAASSHYWLYYYAAKSKAELDDLESAEDYLKKAQAFKKNTSRPDWEPLLKLIFKKKTVVQQKIIHDLQLKKAIYHKKMSELQDLSLSNEIEFKQKLPSLKDELDKLLVTLVTDSRSAARGLEKIMYTFHSLNKPTKDYVEVTTSFSAMQTDLDTLSVFLPNEMITLSIQWLLKVTSYPSNLSRKTAPSLPKKTLQSPFSTLEEKLNSVALDFETGKIDTDFLYSTISQLIELDQKETNPDVKLRISSLLFNYYYFVTILPTTNQEMTEKAIEFLTNALPKVEQHKTVFMFDIADIYYERYRKQIQLHSFLPTYVSTQILALKDLARAYETASEELQAIIRLELCVICNSDAITLKNSIARVRKTLFFTDLNQLNDLRLSRSLKKFEEDVPIFIKNNNQHTEEAREAIILFRDIYKIRQFATKFNLKIPEIEKNAILLEKIRTTKPTIKKHLSISTSAVIQEAVAETKSNLKDILDSHLANIKLWDVQKKWGDALSECHKALAIDPIKTSDRTLTKLVSEIKRLQNSLALRLLNEVTSEITTATNQLKQIVQNIHSFNKTNRDLLKLPASASINPDEIKAQALKKEQVLKKSFTKIKAQYEQSKHLLEQAEQHFITEQRHLSSAKELEHTLKTGKSYIQKIVSFISETNLSTVDTLIAKIETLTQTAKQKIESVKSVAPENPIISSETTPPSLSLMETLKAMAETKEDKERCFKLYKNNQSLQQMQTLNQKIAPLGAFTLLGGTLALHYFLILDGDATEINPADIDWFIYDANKISQKIVREEVYGYGFIPKPIKPNDFFNQYERNDLDKADLSIYSTDYKESFNPFRFTRLGIAFDAKGQATFYDGKYRIDDFKTNQIIQDLKNKLLEIDLPDPIDTSKRVTYFFPRLIKYHEKFHDLKDFKEGDNFKKAMSKQWIYHYFNTAFLDYEPEQGQPPITMEIIRIIREQSLSGSTAKLAKKIIVQFCKAFAHRICLIQDNVLTSIIKELILFYKSHPDSAATFYIELMNKLNPYLATAQAESKTQVLTPDTVPNLSQSTNHFFRHMKRSYSAERSKYVTLTPPKDLRYKKVNLPGEIAITPPPGMGWKKK